MQMFRQKCQGKRGWCWNRVEHSSLWCKQTTVI